MADRTFRLKEAAKLLALREQTYAGTVVVGLFKDTILVTETTPIADILAAECDFDGYVRATDVDLSTLAQLGASAYMILSHVMASFQYGPPAVPPVPNNVAGLFVLVQTAPGPPAVYAPFLVTVFDAPIPMAADLDLIEKVVSEVIPN